MERFRNFVTNFVVCLVGYLILGLFFQYANSIVLAAYMYSLFFLIFTREEKVSSEKLLKDPRIHFYHKSRINMHGYMLVAGAVVSIFIFYLSSFALNLPVGVSSLIGWAFMIGYCIWTDYYISKSVVLDTVSDYMFIALDRKIDDELMDKLVARYFYMQISDIEKKVKDDKDIPEDLKDKFYTAFLKYLQQNFVDGDEITSDKLREINSKNP